MKRSTHITRNFFVITVIFAFLCTPVYAQKVILSEETYLKPPKEIMDVVIAPRHNNYNLSNLSPDGVHFLISKSYGLTKLADMAKPFVNLGETEFDHIASRSRRMSIGRTIGYELYNWKDGSTTVIQVPKDAKVSNASWSPDGSKLAYFAHFYEETHIYIAEVKNGKSKKLTKTPVLATLVSSFYWTNDGIKILTVLLPDKRASQPAPPSVATEPKVRLTREGERTSRTNRFLMERPYDKELLEYLVTGQIAMIEVKNGKVQKIGKPDMYRSMNMSPDGTLFRVSRMLKPFSYFTSMGSFGNIEEMWDNTASVLIDTFSYRNPPDIPRDDDDDRRQIQSKVLKGKTNIGWAPDGNGIMFMNQVGGNDQESRGRQQTRTQRPQRGQQEEQESGDRSSRKYQLMRWLPPFDSTSTELIYEQTENFSGATFSEDFEILFFREGRGGAGGRGRRGREGGLQQSPEKFQQRGAQGRNQESTTQKQFAVRLSDPETKYLIYEYDSGDRFDENGRSLNPGTIMTKRGPNRSSVVRMSTDKQYVYLSGAVTDSLPDVNPEFPFIDRVALFRDGEKERIFEGDQSAYERLGTVFDDNVEQFLVTRETATEPANSFLHDRATGDVKKLTNNIDYSPEITNVQRKEFFVTRVDGFKFRVNVSLPPDYVEGTKLPAMFWFYPREYAGETQEDAQKAYDARITPRNPNRFRSVGTRSMVILTKLGYAVVEPDCPIVGKPNQMNDNYVQDLRNSLWAVIDHLDKLAIIDRDRLGIGGHSYGAFGTANAMIQTPFFKAGIAGDGNYNRSLTPMSFQSERRNLWEAREVYLRMSPLFLAEQLNGALLMYHGMDDANVGTWPINSERMFMMLDGLGKDASLYMYPYEHHGPAAEETQLDMWARWVEWLDKYVKNPEKEEDKEKKKIGAGR